MEELKKTTKKATTKKAAEKTVAAKKTTARSTAKTGCKTTAKTGCRTTAKKTAAKKPAAKKAAPAEKISPFITEVDQYLFGMGTHYEIYKKMGAHLTEKDGVKGVHFAVWAPNAEYVSIMGNFNNWDSSANPMTRLEPMGIWEAFIPELKTGEIYKYYLHTKNGWDLEKADPFASSAELRPGTASRVAETEDYKWTDKTWMTKRESFDVDSCPMSVYEVHPGSWKRHPLNEDQKEYEAFYNYREFAHELVDYVKEMGYTHVELIGMSEHPLDASWGYQVTGYYAPTSRYGTPEDFMYFVDYLHKNKIGVIVDWVPAHFPKDGCGLAEFDGTCLYEHQNPMQGEHPHWGTKIFNYGRNEVKNFLIGSALNWIEQYHVDGLRVDAVASMLYLDFGRNAGEWIPNQYGGRENLEAIEFLRHLNNIVKERNQGALMIAEESTAWPLVTGDPKDGGLGFSLKWNMGWMNDFLEYMQLDPVYRKFHHNQMTFSLMYAFSEKFMLVLSHDEVVHLKKAMLSKMPGELEEQFANLKAGYAFMMGHPGKKLLFMGQEFGQWNEWNENKELDWYLLQDEHHQQLQNFVKALLHLYQKNPALYEQDGSWDGFEWINANDGDRSIFSFIRHSKDSKKNLVFVCNFTPVERPDYSFGMPEKKRLKLILDSADPQFGGNGMEHAKTFTPKAGECDDKPYHVDFPLPAYGVAVFQY
ncbi:MAG: 1,4-alpha-glucan branching protein GlgB [Lachnospiraceae bacterium]|nr:1,4-alpha-glucan branching protein GlgB [Lachnospiraceae bacterium]